MDFNAYIKQAKDMGVDENELKDIMSDFIDEIEDLKAEQEKKKKDAEAEAKVATDLDAKRHEAATALSSYFAVVFPEIADELTVDEIETLMKDEEHKARETFDHVSKFTSMVEKIFGKHNDDEAEHKDTADDIIAKFLKDI